MPNVSVAFPKKTVWKTPLAEYISRLGLKQLRIAETEKYAHVTFFFNGGVETVYERRGPRAHPIPQESPPTTSNPK